MNNSILYRVTIITLLTANVMVVGNLYKEWHSDNQLLAAYRAEVNDLTTENKQLYEELVKMGDEKRALQEELRKGSDGEGNEQGVRRLGRRSA